MVNRRVSTNTLVAMGLALGATLCATAQAADSASALEELRAGYSLKQAGKCTDAIAHFARSFQLDPTAMAALNLSDCEQQAGDLVAAQTHAAQGGELARRQKNEELAAVADKQLATIEPRLPRLAVKLTAGGSECTVSRDGTALPASSIGASLAVNPGAHAILVTCPGHTDGHFDVTVAEGEHAEAAVSPGPAATVPTPVASPGEVPMEPSHETRAHGGIKVGPLVVMGIGAAGLAVGLPTGLAANSKHATLIADCTAQGACPPTERDDIDSFRTLRTVSTVAYIAGAAAVAGGFVWWFVAPSPRRGSAAARVWVGPGSAGIGGRF
jgi:hypothetical protein